MRIRTINCTLVAAILGLALTVPAVSYSASDDATEKRPSFNSENQPGGTWTTKGTPETNATAPPYGSGAPSEKRPSFNSDNQPGGTWNTPSNTTGGTGSGGSGS